MFPRFLSINQKTQVILWSRVHFLRGHILYLTFRGLLGLQLWIGGGGPQKNQHSFPRQLCRGRSLHFPAVQYIFVAYLFYKQQFVSLNPISLSWPFPYPSPPGNHYFFFYICDSLSFLLYSFICFIFQILHKSDSILYFSSSV